MGKGDFLTPKAIAKRIKSKGLLKLKFYCQICQKQCRDANGFKCHLTSESHRRMMGLYVGNAGQFTYEYSGTFEKDFLDILSRRHANTRVAANSVYQEYIGNKQHIHLNSTRWTTLTGFVLYLGRAGICDVDQAESGRWYMKYKRKDPDVLRRQEAIAEKERMAKTDDEITEKFIEEQRRMASGQEGTCSHEFVELRRNAEDEDGGEESFSFSLPDVPVKTKKLKEEKNTKDAGVEILPVEIDVRGKQTEIEMKEKKEVKEKVEIRNSEEKSKKRSRESRRSEPWIIQSAVVAIENGTLKGKDGTRLQGMKAVVLEVQGGGYIGIVRTVKEVGGKRMKVRVDESELRPVVPGVGGKVVIIKGELRGKFGVIRSVNPREGCSTAFIEGEERILPWDALCKYI